MDATSLPYGMRKIMLTPYTDASGTVLATQSVRLPNARTLSFSDTEEFSELRGDDRVVAQHGNGSAVEWEMESGGLPFEAYKVMAGGTIVETGTSGSLRRVYSKKVTDQRPYFRIEGQAISDSGGDVHAVIYRAKATGELSGEFSDGEFFLTSASGVGIAMPDDYIDAELQNMLYEFIQNEQVTDFTEPNPTTAPVISSATPSGQGAGGTVLLQGDRFSSATGVTAGGTAGTNVTVHSDELLSFDLPAGTAGSTDIIVTTAAGASEPFAYTRAA